MEKKKILYISQEITPYLPENDMSEISRYLPQGIQERGREIRTFMPRYGCVNERRNQLHEVIRLSGMNLVINDTDHPLIIKVASIQAARMQVYFIDNEDYFHRKCILTDEHGNEFPDNDERALFFARGVLETVIKLRWAPDIIHCHGWLTSLVPLFIKKYYYNNPLFRNSKLVYSVYNDDFKNTLNSKFSEKLLLEGIKKEDVSVISDPTFENVSKLGINFSDGIIKGTKKINPGVENYISSTGKLYLDHQPKETYIDAYNEFYNKIF
jgi:starch synthase